MDFLSPIYELEEPPMTPLPDANVANTEACIDNDGTSENRTEMITASTNMRETETSIRDAEIYTVNAGSNTHSVGTNSFNSGTSSFNAETSSINSELSFGIMNEEETHLVNSYVNKMEKKKYPVRRSERDSYTSTTPEEDVIGAHNGTEFSTGPDPKRIDDMNLIASKLTDLMERRKKKQNRRSVGEGSKKSEFKSTNTSVTNSVTSIQEVYNVDGENDSLFSDTSFDEAELQDNMKYYIDVMTSGICEDKDREHLKTIILYERIVSDLKNEVAYLKNLLEIVLRCKCT